jgi:GntR family uxuAB operon transcriptional repressor
MADLSHTQTGRAADEDAADRSYVGLAKQIYDLIAAGDVGPRARLPSERTLAARFGVSRTQVREAIIALEVQGVVEVRVGSGIYVAEAPEARCVTFELPRGPGPIETLRARVVIESGIAALANARIRTSTGSSLRCARCAKAWTTRPRTRPLTASSIWRLRGRRETKCSGSW